MRLSSVCTLWVLACFSYCTYGANIVADLSGVKPGPIAVIQAGQSLNVSWSDTSSHQWKATFSLDAAKPLITAIAVDGKNVVTLAQPVYRCSTGKRSGGWDAFFDFPGEPGGYAAVHAGVSSDTGSCTHGRQPGRGDVQRDEAGHL